MKVKLIAGDHEWTLEGTHVCDDKGIAKVLENDQEITVSDDVAARIMPIIEYGRVVRGLMPDGSLPPPPPPQPEEVVEPVEPQPEEVVEPVEPQPEEVVEPVEPQPEEVVEPVEPQPEEVVEPVEPQPEEVVEPIEPQPEETVLMMTKTKKKRG